MFLHKNSQGFSGLAGAGNNLMFWNVGNSESQTETVQGGKANQSEVTVNTDIRKMNF